MCRSMSFGTCVFSDLQPDSIFLIIILFFLSFTWLHVCMGISVFTHVDVCFCVSKILCIIKKVFIFKRNFVLVWKELVG